MGVKLHDSFSCPVLTKDIVIQISYRNIRSNLHATRMHSSRMRTGRSLTVCQVCVCVCVCQRGGGCAGGGCQRRGVPEGWSGPMGEGVVVVSQHAPRQTPPPVNRMTDRCKNITLAATSFRPVKMHIGKVHFKAFTCFKTCLTYRLTNIILLILYFKTRMHSSRMCTVR